MTARNKNIPALRFKEFKDSWNEVKLGEGIDLISGLHLSPEEYNKNNIGMPYFTGPSDFTNDDSKVTKWSLNSTNYGLKRDVLFTVKGSGVGTMSLLQLDKAAMGRQLMAIRSRKFDSEFVYHFLFKKSNYFVALASGNMIPGLSRQDILTLKLDIPSLPEQQKIASFLSAIDEKIRQLTHRKILLEQYKKGVMQQLFSGKLRFKDEKGKTYPKWEEKRLGDITSLLKDGSHGTHKDLSGGKYFLLSAKNINNGRIYIDDSDRLISEQDFTSIYKNYELKENDILLTIVGTIGRVALFRQEKNIAFQRSVAFFRFKKDIPEYIFQLMIGSKFQMELDKRKVVSAQPGIYLGDLAKIPLILPCTKEQQKIASFLSSIDTKIESVTAQIERTQRYKKGLLQQMFV